MKTAKYQFYAGKRYESDTWRENLDINGSTGAETSGNNAISGAIAITDNQFIFTKLAGTSNFTLYFYGENSAYIGMQSSDIQQYLVIPPAGTKSFKAAVSKNHYAYNTLVSSQEHVIYIVDSISPIYKSLKKKYAKESGQQFFRETLEGDIVLTKDDYEYIRNSNLESVFIFIITKYMPAAEGYKIYFQGTFTKTDCVFDTSRKTCKPKISPLDDYTEFLAAYENTYNLIGLTPRITRVSASLRPIIQSYIRGGSTISYFFAGTYTEQDVIEVIDDPAELTGTYHFAFVKVGSEINITDLTGDNADGNGAYAGGGESGTWSNKNGWYLQASMHIYDKGWAIFWLYNASGDRVAGCAYDYYSSVNHTTGDEQGWYIEPGSHTAYLYSDFEEGTGTGEAHTGTLSTFIIYPIYQRILTNRTSIDSKPTYEIGASDMAVSNINYKRCIGLLGGNYFFSTKISDEPTMFGINDYNEYFDNKFIPPSQGQWRPLPVCRSTWGNSSTWYAFDELNYPALDASARSGLIIKDTYLIQDAIQAFLSKVSPGIRHEGIASYSRFLYDTNTPFSDMSRFYVSIAPKSNVLKGNYDQPAQKAEISLKDILDMLRQCFNCYWFISSGQLRIEHLYWFYNGGSYSTEPRLQFNLTNIYDQFNNKKPEYFQSELSYDRNLLAKRYEFGWMDNSTELFDNVTIDVKSNYVPQDKTEDITPLKFSADIDYMLAYPENFSEDGFALLLCNKVTLLGLSAYALPIITMSNIYGEDNLSFSCQVQNGHASWIYLSRFYMRLAPAQSAVINRLGPGLQFANSIIPCMGQDLRIITAEDPTTYGLVRTSHGDGIISEIEVDLDSRATDITLLYPPE